MTKRLGDLQTSEELIFDLYLDLRRRINSWAGITKQTAQARMGYVGQHLVSIVTGYPGGRSGARGKDLVMSSDEYGEIKTCYRVDQLGKCNSCGAVVASIEQECSECGSSELKRNDDSKWLISIRHNEEYALIIEPTLYYLVLFDFTDLNNPHTIRASIWEVDPKNPGFAYCMIDYFENIRSKSVSKAPFNLWPLQMKFELMCPRLIYRSYIFQDDTIKTEIFPGRDAPVPISVFAPTDYSRARNLTVPKLQDFARRIGMQGDLTNNKRTLLGQVEDVVAQNNISADEALNALAKSLYWTDIKDKIPNLPHALRAQLEAAGLV